jgi:hypothetical protein
MVCSIGVVGDLGVVTIIPFTTYYGTSSTVSINTVASSELA